MKKNRSSSSKKWLSEHFKDVFVKKTHVNKLRSRAWFKLHDIHLKYNLFYSGMNVIDLGSTPGSWSQYSAQNVGKYGHVISCDINFMQSIPGVYFLQGDIRNNNTLVMLQKYISGKNIHLVMSDMAPNITGISYIDIPNVLILADLALKIALNTLSKPGIFLLKFFYGFSWEEFLNKLRLFFIDIKICKPNASRNRSREFFILARGLKK